MRRLVLVLLLWVLGGVFPAQAGELKCLSPQGEIWVRPGEILHLEVQGMPGVPALLRLPDGTGIGLFEWEPGRFRGAVLPNRSGTLEVEQAGQVCPLGPVLLLERELPVLEVVREQAPCRSGPDSAFDRLDPLPEGLRSLVSARLNGWLRLEPAGGWVHLESVRLHPVAPSRPILQRVELEEPGDGSARLTMRLGDPAAWRVQAEPELGRLVLWLPGAGQATGHVRQVSHPQRVPLVRLEPSESGVRVILGLGRAGLWGYRLRWQSPDLVLTLAPPPDLPQPDQDTRPLEGLVVALDPGHGGDDSGAIGRDGRRESEVNLEVALALRRLLERAGARVAMTRETDRSVAEPGVPAAEELEARVRLAEQAQAHLFLSIHHNAKASVAEGRVAHGTDIYYYHPQSRELAASLAAPLARAVQESRHAFLWRSFHVIRQTGMPAVLVEVNYLSNPTLEARTRLHGYADQAAGGLYRGLLDFLKVPGDSEGRVRFSESASTRGEACP